jgi:hypothetical protein
MKFSLCVIVLAVATVGPCLGQSESAGQLLFTLINTIPKSAGFRCYIKNGKETNMLTPSGGAADEAPGNGFSTGLVQWSPVDGELVVEAPGRQPASIKPFIKPGETPLVILKAKGSGSVDFSLLPKPPDRKTGFYDAVNLTAQLELELTVDGKKLRLPRGQRVRLTKNKLLKYEVTGGPQDLLESVEDPSHIVVFYGDDAGKIKCMVVADHGS